MGALHPGSTFYFLLFSLARECTETDIRLVGSTYNGRVQICLEGYWKSLCNDNWDYTEAMVVCRQLGYIGSQFADPDE